MPGLGFTNDSLTWHPCRRRSSRHSETLSRGAYKIQQMVCGPQQLVALLCLKLVESEAVKMGSCSSPVADLEVHQAAPASTMNTEGGRELACKLTVALNDFCTSHNPVALMQSPDVEGCSQFIEACVRAEVVPFMHFSGHMLCKAHFA